MNSMNDKLLHHEMKWVKTKKIANTYLVTSFCSVILSLTPNVLHHTIPHELCRCEVKDVHSLQSFVLTHSEKSDSLLFHSLFAITNAFNIYIFESESSHFFRGVCLGVQGVHHCHQEVKS